MSTSRKFKPHTGSGEHRAEKRTTSSTYRFVASNSLSDLAVAFALEEIHDQRLSPLSAATLPAPPSVATLPAPPTANDVPTVPAPADEAPPTVPASVLAKRAVNQ